MKVERHSLLAAVVLVALVALGTAGCAGTAGSVKSLAEAATAPDLVRFTKLSVEVLPRKDVSLTGADRERIVNVIRARIKERAATRFAQLDATPADAQTLHVSIGLTRYDEGSAFARFMLAGLGQIHIDGEVALVEASTRTILGTYEVTKTFAWGGIYGGATTIKDVEIGFADAVADLVLGKTQP
jgi:hypothetical protein